MPNVKAASDNSVEILATVALLRDFPEQGLLRGEAGTVVESLRNSLRSAAILYRELVAWIRWEEFGYQAQARGERCWS